MNSVQQLKQEIITVFQSEIDMRKNFEQDQVPIQIYKATLTVILEKIDAFEKELREKEIVEE